jgi:hypothetical protein
MTEPKNGSPKKPSAKEAAATPAEPEVQPEQEQSAANATTAQATAAVSDAVGAVRERLVSGEQFVLVAAASILVIAYLIFQFLLNFAILSDFAVLLAALTILAIWVHRWGHYDFGPGYRILIGALGVSMALLALMNLLAWARLGGGSIDFLHFIGRLVYWAGGIGAFYGAWLVFRTRED